MIKIIKINVSKYFKNGLVDNKLWLRLLNIKNKIKYHKMN